MSWRRSMVGKARHRPETPGWRSRRPIRHVEVTDPRPRRFIRMQGWRRASTLLLDRPFLFVLRDVDNGAVLFMDRVVDPSLKPGSQ